MAQPSLTHKRKTSTGRSTVDAHLNRNTSLPTRRHGLRARILGRIGAWFLRLAAASWRVEVEGLDRFNRMFARGDRFLLTFWHGKYIPLFPQFPDHRICVFSSESLRGDVIAEVCRQFGYECVQIPDHGRDRSLDLMRKVLADYIAGAIAVDGPLGPYHVVHRGAIQLASELGFVLLPTSVVSRGKRVRADRWDRMELPRLFTRVYLVIGEPINVPVGLTPKEVADWVRRLHDAIEAVDRRAEEKARVDESASA